jgi:hypothetical protein
MGQGSQELIFGAIRSLSLRPRHAFTGEQPFTFRVDGFALGEIRGGAAGTREGTMTRDPMRVLRTAESVTVDKSVPPRVVARPR